jgi:tRNA 2-selenouridine synthase
MDVRAPVEYGQGAFPHTVNLPLMNDDERHDVGIRYKEAGQDEAISLGHELVSGNIKQARVNDWQQFTQSHPEGVLYCFRGGMRSKISQQWIYEQTGIAYPRVKGGYKAMRRFLLDELDLAANTIKPTIISGRTGTGKTVLLQQLRNKIDLEQIYHHRGSVFGIHATPQPSQIDAENQLAIQLLKFRHRNIRHIAFEDESANIGSRRVPENLFALFKAAPLVVLEAAINERVAITFDEYITSALQEYQQLHGEETGFALWAEYLLASIDKIKKRLGGERHHALRTDMQNAISEHRNKHNTEPHKQWIETLLTEYYDPMYDYQLSKKTDRVQFRGTRPEIIEYLHSSCFIS